MPTGVKKLKAVLGGLKPNSQFFKSNLINSKTDQSNLLPSEEFV